MDSLFKGDQMIQAISMTRIDEDEVYNNYIASSGNQNVKYNTLGGRGKSGKSYRNESYYNYEYDAEEYTGNGMFIRAGSIKSLVKYPSGTLSKIWSKRNRQSVNTVDWNKQQQLEEENVLKQQKDKEQCSSKYYRKHSNIETTTEKQTLYNNNRKGRTKSESYSPNQSFNDNGKQVKSGTIGESNSSNSIGRLYCGKDTMWLSEIDLSRQGNNNGKLNFSSGSHTDDEYGFSSPHPSHSSAETIVQDDGRSTSTDTFTNKEQISSVSDYDDGEDEEVFQQYANIKPKSESEYKKAASTTNLTKPSHYISSSGSSASRGKHSSKLRRRKACYREKKDGRSRSLTHIDNLDPAMLLRAEDMDSRSEPDTSQENLLHVPNPGESREGRRKKLARSQVSSSEFFSISFEGDLGTGLEEFLPVTHGTCLGDALRPLFEKKNINISNVNIFVDSSNTPLPSPANTETHFVAGKNLTVRLKEPYHKFHSRSFKQPSRKSSNRTKSKFFSSSTDDTNYGNSGGSPILSSSASLDPGNAHHQQHNHNHQPQPGSMSHEGSLKVKSTKQTNRWSGLFTNSFKDNSKMDLLVEQLNTYSNNGIPRPGFLESDTEEIQSIYSIEEDWKCIVPSWKDMTEKNIQQQTAIWELVETEVVYLRTIKVITDLFLSCLYNLQSSNILNEIDRDQLFSNIPEIHKSNNLLWLDCFLPILQKARDTKQPLQPSELRNGFLRFGSTCQPYTKYCLDQTKCQQYCREKYHDNELFKAYLAWCETRKECNRLRLMDILVRPMQRMTKYSLLLKAILKHTDDFEQRKCLEEMILSVERFVRSVNGALRSRQDAERLQGIAERIEAYDVVETREDELESIVKSHSKLNLFHPMPGCTISKRWLLLESDLKIKDSFTSKMDAHCFLFTDMLLICKPVGRKGEKMKVIRQPYVVDRLITRELSRDPCSLGLVYLNEYGTASAALSLHFNELKMVKVFVDHIKKAQKLYNEAKEKEQLEYPDEDEENEGAIYVNSRNGRIGSSSHASQLSSLMHSHSGSVEMNEASVSSRGVSFENDLRGSSLSSDDGNANDTSSSTGGVNLIKSRSLSTEATSAIPSSPRQDRRSFKSPSPSPNTLSVHIPNSNVSGQSLPNLPSASDSSPAPHSQHHSLTVPKSLLSPTHRGISYPPPSPRSLRRSQALFQSRNPPLQKSKHIITSPEKTVNFDVHVPEIRGVIPPSNDVSPVTNPPPVPPATPCASTSGSTKQYCNSPDPHRKEFNFNPEDSNEFEYESAMMNEDDEILSIHQNIPSSNNQSTDTNFGFPKRLARNDRLDTKRYYTAGVIEDIKRENNRDAAIHKRFSWNYGPHQHEQGQGFQHQTTIPSSRQFFSSESMTSIRSSSGVSSTSSLLHCISDVEQQCTPTTATLNYASTNNTNARPCGKNLTSNCPQHQQLNNHRHHQENIPKPPNEPPPPPPTSASPSKNKQLPNVHVALFETSSDSNSYKNSNDVELDLHEISNHIESHFVEGRQCKNCSPHPEGEEHKSNEGKLENKRSECAVGCKEQMLIRNFILGDASMEASEV